MAILTAKEVMMILSDDITVIVVKRALLVESLWLSLLMKVKQAMPCVAGHGADEDDVCMIIVFRFVNEQIIGDFNLGWARCC